MFILSVRVNCRIVLQWMIHDVWVETDLAFITLVFTAMWRTNKSTLVKYVF